MSRLLRIAPITLSFALLLVGAETPFIGTWEFNSAKSKVMAYPDAVKTSTVTIRDAGSDMVEVTVNGTAVDGTKFSRKYEVATAGGPSTYSEGAPPTGISEMTKKVNESTRDITTSHDGKMLRVSHAVVSTDGKTLILTTKGVTNDGRPLNATQVYEKQ